MRGKAAKRLLLVWLLVLAAFGSVVPVRPSGAVAQETPTASLPPTYWLAGADGRVYSFGSAGVFGSVSGSLARPVVGMAATPTGHGYWLAAADGGVFTFGDAHFYGSLGSTPLAKPVVAITATPTGHGYWLAAADGGVFTFGDALFRGSLGGQALPARVVAIAATESLDPYVPGTTGYDISWPQCGSALPSPPYAFVVLGVGGKVTFTHNPCLGDQAAGIRPALITLYVKLSSPAMGDPAQAATGPAGDCSVADTLCQSYNYGWNLVMDAYNYAESQSVASKMWWLDVERPAGSSTALWTTDVAANDQVIAAAIAALEHLGLQPGVYSNSYQWPLIAGGYTPDVPMWQARPNPDGTPAGSASYCHAGTFTAGPVWLVQYATSPYDQDLAC